MRKLTSILLQTTLATPLNCNASLQSLRDEASLFTFKILPSFSPHPEQSRVERSSYIYGTRPNALFIRGGRGSKNLGVHFMAIRFVEFSMGV